MSRNPRFAQRAFRRQPARGFGRYTRYTPRYQAQKYQQYQHPLYSPNTNAAIGKFLLPWRNVENNKFLQSLRETYISFGKLTPKQKLAMRQQFAKMRQRKVKTYRRGTSYDPVEVNLLTMSPADMQLLSPASQKVATDIRGFLTENKFLTNKQLVTAGQIVNRVQYEKGKASGGASTAAQAPATESVSSL